MSDEPFEQDRWIAVLAAWRRDVLAAAVFLTRLPLPAPDESPVRPLAFAMRAFPVVGAGVGLAAGVAMAIAAAIGLPPLACALIALGAGMLATGALHEDGLADVADGFGGGADREAKLAIMRDSRIGAFGVCALVVALGLKASALAAPLSPWVAPLALAGAGAFSRALIPAAVRALDPARPDGLGASAGRPEATDANVALMLGAALALPVGIEAWLAGLIAASVAGVGVVALARRQIGGHTGDVLGTVQIVSETAFLLAVAAVAS